MKQCPKCESPRIFPLHCADVDDPDNIAYCDNCGYEDAASAFEDDETTESIDADCVDEPMTAEDLDDPDFEVQS